MELRLPTVHVTYFLTIKKRIFFQHDPNFFAPLTTNVAAFSSIEYAVFACNG